MSQEWFTAVELVGLHDLPGTKRGVNKTAARDGWQSRKRETGQGVEYHVSSLPEATRYALAARATKSDRDGERAELAARARDKMAADGIQHAVLGNAQTGMGRLATLEGRGKSRAEARLAILELAHEFARRSGGSQGVAFTRFVAYYQDGVIEVADWIREQCPAFSKATLYRWQKAAREDGAARLSGAYGNRKNSGKIDGQPEILEYVQAMLAEYPHVQGRHLQQALAAQFAGRDIALPSATACQRWLRRWKAQHKPLYTAIANPDAWKSQYMPAFGSASEDITRINQRWELDSTPADVLLTDGRHSLVGVIDIHTRRARLVVSKTSTASAVAAVVRRAILDWGVPESVKHDNGQDYTSHHLARVWQLLGVATLICNPYSGWEKPFIERFFRSFSHDLIELLPGYGGHNVADRQAIEARKAFADRLMKKGEVIEIQMNAAELQAHADRWLAAVYEQREHAGLDGRTPMQAAAGQPYRAIENERALDVLLARAPGDGTRVVGKKGLSVEGYNYIAPELGEHVGQPVLVLLDERDLGRVHVFADTGSGMNHLCVAECPEITGISRKEVAERTKAMNTREVQGQRAAMKRAAKKHKTADVAEQILADRERQAARVTGLPGRAEAYESEGLSAARDAVDALDRADAPAAEPERMDPVARRGFNDSFYIEQQQEPREMTARQAFAKWERLKKAPELSAGDHAWLANYELSDQFRARFQVFYNRDFDPQEDSARV